MFPVIFDGPASARAGRDEYVQGSAGDKIACPTAKNLLRVQKIWNVLPPVVVAFFSGAMQGSADWHYTPTRKLQHIKKPESKRPSEVPEFGWAGTEMERKSGVGVGVIEPYVNGEIHVCNESFRSAVASQGLRGRGGLNGYESYQNISRD
jgi:hypothetical protein